MLVAALYAAHLLGEHCAGRWNGNADTLPAKFMWVMGAVVSASLLVYGCTMTTVQATFLCGAFLFSSYSDLKSRQVDDGVSVLILAVALIGRNFEDIFMMAISAGLICGLMLVVPILSKGSGIGGADIKIAVACAFLLGIQRALIGLIIGLLAAVIHNGIQQKKTGKKEGFPLVPYLAIGFMLSFYIHS